MTGRSYSISFLVMAGLMLVMLLVSLGRMPGNIISWDTFGYYLYLPATLIHGDPGLYDPAFAYEVIDKYQSSSTFYQVSANPQGGMIIKYTSGLALIFLPGFIISHLVALSSAFPADGFSLPYQYSVLFTGILFMIMGMVVMRKVLLRFFTDKMTTLLLLFLYAGTNLFYIATHHATIHNFLFSLYALLLWLVIRWHEKPGKRRSLQLGLVMGFIIMIRPSEAVCVFLPLLWGVYDRHSLKQKLALLRSRFPLLLLTALGMLIALSPQLVYWKAFTGKILHYSYDNPGEGFDWGSPYLLQVLFSFRKGWLVYTPMMVFALAGFYFTYNKKREIFYPLLVFTLLNLYVVSSWTTWWYASSFGQRALVQSYAVLVIPMGYFFSAVSSMGRKRAVVIFSIAGLFVVLSLFQTWQYTRGIIHPQNMTREYYFAVFGRMKQPDEQLQNLLLLERSFTATDFFSKPEDYFLHSSYNLEGEFTRKKDPNALFINQEGLAVEILSPENPYSRTLSIPFYKLSNGDHAFLKIKGEVFVEDDPVENAFTLVVTFQHKGRNYKYRGKNSEVIAADLIPGQWNTLEVLYLTPEVRHTKDPVLIYFWLRGSQQLAVRSITVESWAPVRGW